MPVLKKFGGTAGTMTKNTECNMRSGLRHRLVLAGSAILLMLVSACTHLDGTRVDQDRLYAAILRDDVAHVRSLIQSGALNVNQSISVPGYVEGTPLVTVAARSASLGVLRYLLSAGADVNARTPVNETALMLACFFYSEDRDRNANSRARHDEAVRILLAAGAEVENDPYHYTPLSYAAYQGHDAAVRMLLTRGARVDADAHDGGTYINTPLMMAAMQGHMSTALELLRAGANAGIRVHGGHTASELAAKYRHAELARMLQCASHHKPGSFAPDRCQPGMARGRASPRATVGPADR